MLSRRLLCGSILSGLMGCDADAGFFRSGAVLAPPTGTTSKTQTNLSASSSPATTPIQIGQGFKRGTVPTGYIAVPTIAGVPLIYQADDRKYWDDGSLCHATFRCVTGSIGSGGTKKVDFPVSAGSYTNASAIAPADITANSDYKIAITGLHTAQTAVVSQLSVSLAMSGGVITGGTCWANHAGFSGTLNVANGGGTGGQVSISGTTVSVVAPGSGYTTVGSGAFNIGFNSIIAAITSGGNHNGASLVQYAKGPVCDAWRARSPVSGLPHFHATFYVERWKDGSGAFAYFRAYCVYGVGLIDQTNALYNYTFSLDWKNGSTVIRGTTNGDAGYTNNTVYMGGSASTLCPASAGISYVDSARPDWSSDGAVLNAIISTPTATECEQMKGTGLILPWLSTISPTVPQPTTALSYTTDGQENNYICVYQPNGSAGLRCPFGSGGSGHNEAPMPDVNTLHWMWCRQGDPTKAKLWLTNSRTAAAHGLGAVVTGSGLYDPTTLYVPNVVPVGAQVFSGMTPTLQAKSVSDITMNGYMHPYLEGSSSWLYSLSTYHQPFYAAYVYLLEGEQWQADAMLNAGACQPYCWSQVYHRQMSLGSTTYYGVMGNSGTNERIQAWWTMAACYASAFSPTQWSDGTTHIEHDYAAYIAGQTPAYLSALVSFTGTVTIGTGGGTAAKTVDYTGSGVHPELFMGTPKSSSEVGVPFMNDYTAMCTTFGAFLLQGTTAGTALASYRDYMKIQYVGLYAYSGSHYLNDSFRINQIVNAAANSAPSDPTWSDWGDTTSPGMAAYPHNAGGANGISINFTSGLSTVQLVRQGTSTPDSMILQGTTRIASGSRMKLTRTNLETTSVLVATIPTGFDDTTWYYWKELTATTGQICTDAALTVPVTPSSSSNNVFFWVVPSNVLPADNSGAGLYNSQGSTGGSARFATKLGTCRMMQRYGVSDSPYSLTKAIANLDTVVVAVNGSDAACFSGYPLYAWDNAAP